MVTKSVRGKPNPGFPPRPIVLSTSLQGGLLAVESCAVHHSPRHTLVSQTLTASAVCLCAHPVYTDLSTHRANSLFIFLVLSLWALRLQPCTIP